MRKSNQPDILRILIIVFAVLIVVCTVGGGIYLISASKKLKAVELSPDFMETELAVGTTYTFSVNTTPAKAGTKKISCVVDDPLCTFEMSKDGKATLTTGLSEGTVTLYVESKDKKVKSQVLTFGVVDAVARAQAEAELAAAAAEAEAAAAAEAEAAAMAEAEEAARTKYVKCIGDDVRVRAENNTDCDILGKANNGAIFEKVEDVDDWTHIIYKGQDGYMKSEYLTEISEEEAMAAPAEEEKVEEKKAEEKKTEEKKTEEKKPEATTDNTEQASTATQTKEEAEAKAAAAALEAAQKELEAAAAAQAAAAAAGTVIHCKDGDCLVTPAQLNTIHATWDFAGDAIEMAGHHSVSELEAVVGAVTRL